MILTAKKIEQEMHVSNIIIQPFYKHFLEPNSYGFHLNSKLIIYDTDYIDSKKKPPEKEITIPPEGYCLQNGKFYMGSTIETIGSYKYVSTLYANRSTASLGMWIQFSAPLGHTGAVIPWTLEINVAHDIIVYPGMLIGKIAFWDVQGDYLTYNGKYIDSTDVVSSKLADEMNEEHKCDFNRK